MSLSKLSLSPFAPPSATLAHVNRLLSSTSGQDKPFMLVSCQSRAAAPYLCGPLLLGTQKSLC